MVRLDRGARLYFTTKLCFLLICQRDTKLTLACTPSGLSFPDLTARFTYPTGLSNLLTNLSKYQKDTDSIIILLLFVKRYITKMCTLLMYYEHTT